MLSTNRQIKITREREDYEVFDPDMSLSTVLCKPLVEYLEKNDIKTPDQAIKTPDNYYLRVLNLSTNDVKLIKNAAASLLLPQGISSAFDKFHKETLLGKLSTGCEVIDGYLEGGLRIGSLVEIYGESGCGKTQISLQIAAQCWQQGAVYICTEGVFPSKRLQELLSGISKEHCNKVGNYKNGEKIFILNVIELDDLKRCINIQLPRLLQANRTISLVVVDSIAAPFRSDFQNDMKKRASHLKEIGMILLKLAAEHNLVSLVTNQVLSTMDSLDETFIPCLGLTWSNMLTSRIQVKKIDKYCRISDILSNKNNALKTDASIVQMRQMNIVTSPELPSTASINYIITGRGVAGVL